MKLTTSELMELGARQEREAKLRSESITHFNAGRYQLSRPLWEEANKHLRRIIELKLWQGLPA